MTLILKIHGHMTQKSQKYRGSEKNLKRVGDQAQNLRPKNRAFFNYANNGYYLSVFQYYSIVKYDKTGICYPLLVSFDYCV